jgi:DNA-binding MarR family transcriptional regulator
MPKQNELDGSLADLQEDIFRRLVHLTAMIRQWSALMSQGQADQLTLAQAMILHWIRVNTPYPSTIARRLGVTPTAVTGQITRLERLGYLTRGIDPTDRRRVILTLTPKGQQRSELAEEQFRRFISPSSNGLSDQDVEHINGGLEMLENILQHLNNDLIARHGPLDSDVLDDGADERQ